MGNTYLQHSRTSTLTVPLCHTNNMAPPVTLKVSNRIPKKPIKKLPTSIEITDKTTVQDVKEQLAKKAGGMDPERLGIYDAEKKKLLKDRKALVNSSEDVMSGKEILVKDLGPQLSWTTVFIIEYLGPILIHLAIPLLLRPYLYSSAPPLSSSQYLSMAMIVLHFIKREYETVFVHKFSLATMPLLNIFKNSAHYWLLSGLNIAYWIYAPNSYTAKSSPTIDLVNYVGLALVSKSAATVIFNAIAWAQMHQWAIKKEKALRAEFPDKYKKKKYVLLPSPGAVVKYLMG